MSLIIHSNVYEQTIKTNIDYIFKHSILHDKLWEADICEYISNLIVDGTDFMDIGANIGLITLGVKILLRFKNKKIRKSHCIECNDEIFLSLKHNTSLHQDINIYNFALSDKQQLCSMSTNEYNNGCNIIDTTYSGTDISTYHYEHMSTSTFIKKSNIFYSAISLDSICDTFTNKVSLVKIDVEGFEYLVLQGAKMFLEKHKPTILIEIFDSEFIKINNLLTENNYALENSLGNLNYIYTYSKLEKQL
jgi:FkbM family methyltransferase